ncbi:Omp28-related outer membrane protein [Aequorivita lipolytica]|uniref:Omp28-related outer membrane protein n=1 Tax=Aequorivita lipolytica TaxID=153267 RepID=A0A5C6YNX7_9FLAO|nr:Omp28-related outer membrane protein [Aequorivita lipolytica]TXD68927.1 Omp28-related outer membrane protein [Aequorivita lipolytica]SRX53103.1 hypothetical protein AEQU2_02331 [Aequorivita lipolytica]
MKTHPYFQLLFLFAFVAIVSCSKKEDPFVEADPMLTLELKSSAGTGELEVLSVNDSVYFTVNGNNGEDYSDIATYYVNETAISARAYFFRQTGTYAVKAVYNDVNSNILNFEVLAPTERALTIDVTKALRDQTITFGLLDSDGNNTASEAIFYVNNDEISGFTYSSATPGNFDVYAKYEVNNEQQTSVTKPFEVFIPKRKVVIEDYTGTWCGFCPAVALAIENVEAVTEHVSVVAIHKTASSYPDPLDFDRIEDLQQMFGVSNGFPKAQLNRTVSWAEPYNIGEVTAMAGNDTDLSMAINSQLTGANLTVQVKVIYENGSEAGDKLVVYLLENGVVAPQANYFNETPGHPYEGLGNPIVDYVHNHGLRNSLSDLFGDAIPQTPAFQEFKKSYSFVVPSNYVGDNLSFVVMVVRADNSAKNSQFSKINENKNYE